jgi:polysaccharide pyruvyl transferase WcaK-like protein
MYDSSGVTPLRLTLCGACMAGNMGGPALNLGLASALGERTGAVRITLLSKYPEDDAGPCAALGWKCVPYPNHLQLLLGVPFSLVYWGLRTLRLPRRWLARGPFTAFSEADVVADLSGISFTDDRPLSGLVINALWLAPAVATGTPYIKVSQAMGPFHRNTVRWLARFFLGRAHGIVARGETTQRHVLELLPMARVPVLPDVAFAMPPAPDEEVWAALATLGLEAGAAYCVVGPSGVVDELMGSGATPEAYTRLMARVADEIAALSGMPILLLPHSRSTARNPSDDLTACEAVLRQAQRRNQLIVVRDRVPAPLLKGIVGHSTVAIGSRFHFIVAALGSGVPALAVGWSHKYHEMMAMLGQEAYALGHENADEQSVVARVRALWENRASIRTRLVAALPEIRRAAARNADVVLDAASAR